MQPKTSRDLPAQEPRKDTEREMQDAIVKDRKHDGTSERDAIHGDGGEIGLDDDK